MKKIYSFMLLAVAMLLSVNARAATKTVGTSLSGADYQTLVAAFNAADSGDTIKLLSNITSNDKIHIKLDGTLTLDLNNDTISISSELRPFYLYKGTLKVTGSGAIRNNVTDEGTQIFYVYGTFAPVEGFTSHLIIDENVSLLVPNGTKGRGIHVATSIASEGAVAYSDLPYNGIIGSSWGFAHGVIVDVYGNITVTTTKGYCVQVSGRVRYPGEYADNSYTWAGTERTVVEAWKAYAPQINLHNTCHLTSNNDAQEAATMYAAGYAVWNIECTAEGSCALAAKSGNITIGGDAKLYSTALQYDPVKSKTSASGIDTKGSAVVIETNNSYAGNISVTFNGDPTIQALSGYAIEEAITTSNTQSKVTSISINGGTFVGGNDERAGCIVVSSGTQANATISIGGGSYTAQTMDQQNATQTLLETLLGNTEHPYSPEKTIEIDNGGISQTGSSIVISTTKIPDPVTSQYTFGDLKTAALNGKDVNLAEAQVEGDTLKIEESIELQNLFMNHNTGLIIVIKNGITMSAKRIVMGDKDKIIVEAGGTLVVYGDQGLYNVKNENLIIEAQEGKMGMFIFQPTVATNRHPHAIVQLISKGYGNGAVWQRFGVPALNGLTAPQIMKVGHNSGTYYMYWDNDLDDWADISSAQFVMEPFKGFAMTNDASEGRKKYAMPCEGLYGSINAPLEFVPAWNYHSNSYTAKVGIYSLIEKLMTAGRDVTPNGFMEGGIHIQPLTSNIWEPISYADLVGGDVDANIALDPMQTFATKNISMEHFKDTFNYEDMVWNYYLSATNANPAPARRNMMAAGYDKAIVVINNGEGEQKVTLRQGAQFSEDFDNGYELSSMKAGDFSIYANAEIGDMAQIATDNLIGQTLTVESAKAATFKMTFKGLNGEKFAIRDNVTGTVIDMTADAEYYFSVAPNTVAERFEIVEAAKMPTDVEMIEAAPAKKGIYSLQGQYLGENFHVLPAGIYVVNGKKVVK